LSFAQQNLGKFYLQSFAIFVCSIKDLFMEHIMATPSASANDSLDMGVLLATLTAYRNGDFSARMPGNWIGLPGKIADTLNDIIDMSSGTITEFERVARLVGKQGKVGERIELPMMRGSWEKLVDNSNALANDLVSPMNEMIRVIGSVADGDLGQQVPMEIDGLKLKGQFLKSAEIAKSAPKVFSAARPK
jgi:hypothetical protein